MTRLRYRHPPVTAFAAGVLFLLAICLASKANTAPALDGYTVAFRFDDVQDFWLSQTQQAVISLFAEHDMKLTLGAVGGYIGNDEPLMELIRSKRDILSIANHGLHAKNDAQGYSVLLMQSADSTRHELSEAKDKLSKLFDKMPVTYIPHQNEFNASVLETAGGLGFTHISSACRRHLGLEECPDDCAYRGASSICGKPDAYNLIHIPSGASTQWEPMAGKGMAPVGTVLEEIQKSIETYCFAVVMLHPQDFATADERPDQKQLESLDALLRKIRSRPETFNVVWLREVEPRCP